MRELRLPAQPILAEDLGRDGELAAALEQARADDDFGPQDGLVVVDVRGAVGAVVAVYRFARVTVVGVGFCGTFCDFEIAFVGHLVEGALAAAEELAGVAVAKDVGITVDFGGPFRLAAVAFSLVGRHGC